jgi:hypothetical protein
MRIDIRSIRRLRRASRLDGSVSSVAEVTKASGSSVFVSFVVFPYCGRLRLLPDQLADAFGCHQMKNVFSCEAKEIALGSQLKRAHCHSVLQPANEIFFQ